MKTLQNNFTTPEQSKRLLELGLPADSADCYYMIYADGEVINPDEPDIINFKDNFIDTNCELPCWSVGRLIEIYTITRDADFIEFDVYANNPCVMKEILERIESNIDKLDFSKLDE